MFSIAMFSLFAAVAPAQEVIEDLDNQECEFYEEYAEEADSGEVVFSDDVLNAESSDVEEIVFDEE